MRLIKVVIMKTKFGRIGVIILIILLSMFLSNARSIPGPRALRIWTVDDDLQDYIDADFTKIQDAINNAVIGDVIVVYPGDYYENIVVNKTLTLTGQEAILFGDGTDPVIHITELSVSITGFFIQDGGYGILIDNTSDAYIGNNTMLDCNRPGIQLFYSTDSALVNNSISDSQYGIYLQSSDDNMIISNTIEYIWNSDIQLRYSDGNVITNNLFKNNEWDGLDINYDSHNNVINDNEFIKSGITVRCENNHISSNNTVNGKPLYYYEGYRGAGISVPLDAGQVIIYNSTNIEVVGLHISDTSTAVELYNSENITVHHNELSNTEYYGIWIYGSTNNDIHNNTVSENLVGIEIEDSDGNTLRNNTILDSGWIGLELYGSSYVTVVDNTFENGGISLYRHSQDNQIHNNSINGRPLVYLEDRSNEYIDEAGQVILVNCVNIVIDGINASHAGVGIELWNTSDSEIIDSTIYSNNCNGIFLHDSNRNTISRNYISDGWNRGVYLVSSEENLISSNEISDFGRGLMISSSENLIIGNNVTWNRIGFQMYSGNNELYYNNILNNTDQVEETSSGNSWDDGSGRGNYWSDYEGEDTDGDGVGETLLPHQDVDYYPLMEPWNTLVSIYTREIALFEGWNFIGLPLSPEDSSFEIILSEIIDYVESVWAFDGETKTWSSYSPGAPSNLVEMVEGSGYWIKVAEDVTLTVRGESVNTSELALFEGWNLIGIPFCPEDPSIELMLYDILDYVESVWTYEAYTGTWLSYTPGAPSNLTQIIEGKGYWIKVSTTLVWELGIG